MTPTITVDTREFHAALREYLSTTRRTLAEATNSRMFYVLARAFILTKPQQAQAERTRIRNYLNETIGERRKDKKTGKFVGRARQLRRVHLIVQAKRAKAGEKGLYGADMAEAAASFRRQAVGSVGYLKSGIAKAIKQLRGSFTQFGRQVKMKLQPGQTRRASREVMGNAALIRFAQEYGTAQSNVAMHRGVRAFVTKATDGFSPTATADIGWNIQDGQEGRVSAVVNPACQRAFDDEAREITRYLASVMQDEANQFMVPELRRAA